MKQYQIGNGVLSLKEVKDVKAIGTKVKIQMKARSLNYRDSMVLSGEAREGLVPLSDGAGEVVDIGPSVTKWNIGDRVMPTFFQDRNDGTIKEEYTSKALGGSIDGILSEYILVEEKDLVSVPNHITREEAAALPCAGVTARNALSKLNTIQDKNILIQGTGGVSLFALLFAKVLGATVFLLSSSDQKLIKAKTMGADHTINYKRTPDWDKEVLVLTKNKGVDLVIEVGGPNTLQKSLNCLAFGGIVAMIGVLSGMSAKIDILPILRKNITIKGIFVGSKKMFEDMVEFMEMHCIHSNIHKSFGFEQVKDAFSFLGKGEHMGKIVIKKP